MENADRIADGHYARKQLHCPSRVVAWSHGSRFELARALVAPYAGGRLLDYGCGDGTFIAMVHASFAEAHGADVDPEQIAACRRRLGDLRGVSFGLTADTAGGHGAWSVITCMEVLEHCLEQERRRILDQLVSLCALDGRVIISVPIETGPSLLVKQCVRAVAGLRGLGDYAHRERYSAAEMIRAMAGLSVPRVVYTGAGANGPFSYYGHKGFDWRDVEQEVAARFRIERRLFTPVRVTGRLANSQAWFVCARP
jgi:2-polyprenyl-3-methyl-5-hydroxy-6-metoxy-1,4-benzoquinol methylase